MTRPPLAGTDGPVASSGGTYPEPSDPELIMAVRAGEAASFALLRSRHEAAVRRLAEVLYDRERDPDTTAHATATTDPTSSTSAAAETVAALLDDTFAGIRTELEAGNGPQVAFRGYALMRVHQIVADRFRRTGPTTAVAEIPDTPLRSAFADLPERWRLMLWHVHVDGDGPEQVAALVGMTPRAVVVATHQAHQRLQERYARALHPEPDAECQQTITLLTRIADEEAAEQAKAHTATCQTCRMVQAELVALGEDMAGALADAVLGPAAAGYLGRNGRHERGIAVSWLGRWRGGASAWLRPYRKRWGSSRVTAGAAVAAMVGVITAVAVAAVVLRPAEQPPTAAPNHRKAPLAAAPSDNSSTPPATSPTAVPGESTGLSPSPTSVTASVTPDAPSQTPSATSSPPPKFAPRLEITSAGAFRELVAGRNGTLVVTVRNTGSAAATAVRLTVRLPRGFRLAGRGGGDGWHCGGSGDEVRCTRLVIAAGASTTAAVQVAIDRSVSGEHTVSAHVSSANTADSTSFTVIVTQKGDGKD